MANNSNAEFWQKQFYSLEKEYKDLYKCYELSHTRNKEANVKISELLKEIEQLKMDVKAYQYQVDVAKGIFD